MALLFGGNMLLNALDNAFILFGHPVELNTVGAKTYTANFYIAL
jgi:hypothetical protein